MSFTEEIIGLPGLMKTSVEQLHKVPALTETAILTVLNVAVDTLFVSTTLTLRIGFSGIPVAICGMCYGPICTGFVGVIADTLKYIIRPNNPYFPGFAVDGFLTGMTYSRFFYKRKITPPRVVIARACTTVFVDLILASLWLDMVYQSPLFTMVWPIKNVMTFPVDVALLYATLGDAGGVRRT